MAGKSNNVTRPKNTYLKALVWGNKWVLNGGSITYRMAYDSSYSYEWYSSEATGFAKALNAWAKVCNISFKKVSASTSSADMSFYSVDDDYLGSGTEGMQYGPEVGDSESGDGWYNWQAFDYWESGLKPGGYSFTTILHELGHGIGLAHPHDTGGGSTKFPGVSSAWDTGTNGQNSNIYTVMSYISIGEKWFPSGEKTSGFLETPMAFDIAAVQAIYGKKASNTGNNTYSINDLSGYNCIWDTKGKDKITYSGTADVIIDLRPAPLTGANAGGYVSYTYKKVGTPSASRGYTIANGVVIEEASGGSGDDILTGNGVANALRGNGGSDSLIGGDGKDYLVGGGGKDVFVVASKSSGLDTVTDFSTSQNDRVGISKSGFGLASPKGALSSSVFTANSSGTATSSSQRFIFKTSNGTLYYDRDGSGSASAVALIKLNGINSLSSSQILVV